MKAKHRTMLRQLPAFPHPSATPTPSPPGKAKMRRERDGALRRCASFVQSSRDHGTPERKRAALSVPSPLGKTGTETHGVSNEFPCGKHHAQRWMRALWQLARHCAMPCFHQSLIRRLRRHLPHRGRLRCGGRPMVAPTVSGEFVQIGRGRRLSHHAKNRPAVQGGLFLYGQLRMGRRSRATMYCFCPV